ncbi:MAG TPA: Pycsar system effector family protein [Candidatus Methylomirabilis sp.]|nr:Pycsar system effector family protein [Candidatus Methylomirabilis sp.]
MIEMAENGPQSLPLRLAFVMSAYNTAQRMIRFSDEKASFVFLFFGIILSIFGIRGDRILLILGGQARPGSFRALFIALFLLFLGTMVVSLFYGLRTIIPHLRVPAASPDHLRLYWFQDVLRLPASEYLARLRGLSDEGVVREMVQELYVVMAIERAKFDRINRCLRWAVASFILWVIVILMTLGS